MSVSQIHGGRALLSDHATSNDLLGYEPYVASLHELLIQPSVKTPFAVGVFGPWGTGKSSFMYQLHQRLTNNNIPTVWFQPWLFDEKEEVWKALILSILQYLEDKTDDKTQIALIKNLVIGVGKIALNQVISKATGSDFTVDQITQLFSDSSNHSTRFINTFRRDFGEVKDAILSSNSQSHGRLYVFVDDLDRCTPDNCVRVLEAIRLFFDLEGCLFILGIDQEIVQKGIEIKYDQHLQMRGRDYLEKLIQLPFTLPPISEQSFESFVRTTTAPFQFKEQSRKLIALASERNPRRVKRLSNCLELLRTATLFIAGNNTAPKILDSSDAELYLAYLLALQVRFPIASRWLFENLDYISGESSLSESKEELISWLKVSYSPETATSVANEVLSFVTKSQEDILKDLDLNNTEAFVSVTALVDTRSKSVESPKKLIIDNQYARTKTTEADSNEENEGQRMPRPLTPESNSAPHSEHISQLVKSIDSSLDSLDSVLEPSFISVLFRFNDRLFRSASENIKIISHTVDILSELDHAAVPIRASVIANDHEDSHLVGLAHHLKGFGWAISALGAVLSVVTLLWSTWSYNATDSFVATPLGIALIWLLPVLSFILFFRGILIFLYSNRRLEELQ